MLWIGIDLCRSIFMWMLIKTRIRIGIKTIPIHMRILPQVLYMLENKGEN
jgi:hypothetical protein